MSLADEILLLESRLDRYALRVARELAFPLLALLTEVDRVLRRAGGSPLTKAEQQAVQAFVASRSDDVLQSIALVQSIAQTAAGLAPRALSRGLRQQGTTPTAEQIAEATTEARHAANNVTLGDETPAYYVRKLYADASASLASLLSQSVALSQTGDVARTQLASVAAKVQAGAETVARSTATATAHAVKVAALGKLSPGQVVAYEFVSVLDNRTSAMCRGLSGTVWRAERKADLERIKPPRHPNCRSSLVPLNQLEFGKLKARAEAESDLDIDALNNAVDEGTTLKASRTAVDSAAALRAIGKGAPADFRTFPEFRVSAYDDWLAGQSEVVQREILGSTRFLAWKRGLPLSRMSTFNRPLRLDELNKLYPDEFGGAA